MAVDGAVSGMSLHKVAQSKVGEWPTFNSPTPTLVRRVLVEAAWHYQHRPGVGVVLARRRQGQPGRVIAIADTAQQPLCRRFRKLAAEHKPAGKVVVAIARELTGFLWAALQPEPVGAH